MLAKISNRLNAFHNDERGVVAVMFALSAVGLLLTSGLAIDVGRAVHASSRIGAALDAAALAGAKAMRLQGLTKAETISLTEDVFQANMRQLNDPVAINDLRVKVNVAKSEVEVEVDAAIPMTLGKLAGMTEMALGKSATAIFEAKDIEIAVQLDVTGSMSGSKMVDLKEATKLLVDTVIPDEPTGQTIRVAYAPYSSGVNAGGLADAVTGGAASAAGSACTFERLNDADQTTDFAPYGAAALRSMDDLPAGAPRAACPPARVLPLTDNKDVLKATVDSYSTAGYTAGHLGTSWTYYLLSPNWAGLYGADAKPVNYDDEQTMKFAILMTDGEYNTYNAGPNVTKSSTAAKDICAAMKSSGIVIYTVGFMLTDATAKDVMTTCASGVTKAYAADSGDALKAAFKDIAEDIVTLRLTN